MKPQGLDAVKWLANWLEENNPNHLTVLWTENNSFVSTVEDEIELFFVHSIFSKNLNRMVSSLILNTCVMNTYEHCINA